jgi:hypothetical protein
LNSFTDVFRDRFPHKFEQENKDLKPIKKRKLRYLTNSTRNGDRAFFSLFLFVIGALPYRLGATD